MFIFNMDLVITKKKTESLFLKKKLCHSYVKEYEIEKSVYL